MASVREYAILYVRGTRVANTIIGGGNTVLAAGQHAHDGPEHTGQLPIERISTDELDTTLVYAPDGTGGVVARAETGGIETPVDHGSMGAAETIDFAAGGVHKGVLDDDLVLTVTGFTVDEFGLMLFRVTQDGTGGHAITQDADVVFAGGDQPAQAAGEETWFIYWSIEGDSTVYGAIVGGGSSVDVLDDLSDVTITAPAEDQQIQRIGGQWVNNARKFRPVTHDFGSGPELVWDGDDLVMEWF